MNWDEKRFISKKYSRKKLDNKYKLFNQKADNIKISLQYMIYVWFCTLRFKQW